MKRCLMCLLTVLAFDASAEIVERPVDYEIDGTAFQSVLVYDDANGMKDRPGLLMVPNWLGINAIAIARARDLAGDDYVILVADMYGAGVRPANFEEAGKASGVVTADRAMMRARAQRALDALKQADKGLVDAERIVAFGFCFGGTTAIELARAGVDIQGAVSFHGNPAPAPGVESVRSKADMLILHGADDSFVPPQNLRAFEDERREKGGDYTLVSLSGARHCFAEKEADDRPPGCIYDERAAVVAYDLFDRFLDDQLDAD